MTGWDNINIGNGYHSDPVAGNGPVAVLLDFTMDTERTIPLIT